MAKIVRFEDIEAWQKARVLTREIYLVSRTGEFARDFGLRNQIQRSAVSVMANVAEGFERDGNAEFRQFLSLAKASAGEVRSHLYVARDVGYIDDETFDRLTGLAIEVCVLIRGFIRYLERSNLAGPKFANRERP